MSTRVSWSGPLKKISSWVRPGVREVRASALRAVSAVIRLDLPTLERPAKAISTPFIGGSEASDDAAATNCQSPLNSLSGARSLMRGEHHKGPRRSRYASVTFFLNSPLTAFQVSLRLSPSSILAPLRFMMNACCATDSVLFHAQ